MKNEDLLTTSLYCAAVRRGALLLILLGNAWLLPAQTVIIDANQNRVPITQVVYSINGNLLTQTTEGTGGQTTVASVDLETLSVNDGGTIVELDVINGSGVSVQNLNLTTNAGGVGVFQNASFTNTSDLTAFQNALVGSSSTLDLMDYLAFDGVSNLPPPGVADFDLQYTFPILADDYIIVSERNGNSTFRIVPLDSNGQPIAGADTLEFRGPYDWDTGFQNASDPANQRLFLTVAKASLFFNTPAAFQPVYGYRIDNISEADVKFFGGSDNSFENNLCQTDNPVIGTIPRLRGPSWAANSIRQPLPSITWRMLPTSASAGPTRPVTTAPTLPTLPI